jgi:uncharacterized protein (TIGR00369 family)
MTDRIAEVRERVERSAFHSRFFGMRLERVVEGEVDVALEVRPEHRNLLGTVHGGVIATLADTATGLAYRTVLAEGTQHVTSQLSVTFLAPAREGTIVARGAVVKRGKRSGYGEADVVDDEGTLLARASALFAVFPERTGVDRSPEPPAQ